MAYLTKFWDKQEPINGVPADEVLKDAFLKNARRVFLGYDEETGIITRMESVDVIKLSNKLVNFTDQQVIDWYKEDMNKEPDPTPETPVEQAPSQSELDIMESQAAIYEQNAAILEQLSTLTAASSN